MTDVVLTVVIVAAICLICHKFIWAILQRMFEAFKSENFMSSLLTDRDEIWSIYLTKIFESPISFLVGNGMFTEQLYAASQMGPAETHNFYISYYF